MIDLAWLNATKEQDPDFAGSMWEEMGYDNALCPTCKAHLRGGICLNACHLGSKSRQQFSDLIRAVRTGRTSR